MASKHQKTYITTYVIIVIHMDYKSKLNDGTDDAHIEDLIHKDDNDGFKSCHSALDEYAQMQSHVTKCHMPSKALPGTVMDALENIHSNISGYWSQFGILDRSNSKEFVSWAKNTFAFKEYRIAKCAILPSSTNMNDIPIDGGK